MQVEECIGVPFYVREISGRSCNTALVYEAEGGGGEEEVRDEVEDLYMLLKEVRVHHPEVMAVSSGAILSTYQRTRIENVCSRLNLTSLSYLWRMSSQRTILDSILDDGQIDAVLVRVACPPGLVPHRHLGKQLRSLRDSGILDQLKDRWGIHPAGEGGEYETLVVDCQTLFKYGRLVLEETEVVCDESDDGVGVLRIVKCSVEKKDVSIGDGDGSQDTIAAVSLDVSRQITDQVQSTTLSQSASDATSMSSHVNDRLIRSMHIPNVKMMRGGLCHISALLSPIACNQGQREEANAAVQEFLLILQILKTILSRMSPQTTKPQNDILFVHLYLSQISHFANINQHYKQFFGIHLPPSRSCVAVGSGTLPGGRRVMMDCVLQLGSGEYLRHDGTAIGNASSFLQQNIQNKQHALRKTLHVQSISNWAPVCIGPYSQANTLRSSLVFLAGMIGLIPQSMSLIEPCNVDGNRRVVDWEVQLYQSWRNAAAVLDGLEDGGGVMGGKLDDCLGGLVYISVGALETILASEAEETAEMPWQELWTTAQRISQNAFSTNGSIAMGSVDGVGSETPSTDLDPSLYDEAGVLYGGYEDEDTWREMKGGVSAKTPESETENSSRVPILMVCLPELPMNAKAEVELVCASRRAALSLTLSTGRLVRSAMQPRNNDGGKDLGMLWDTGYNPPPITECDNKTLPIEITTISRSVGTGCACISTVVASWKSSIADETEETSLTSLNMEDILSRMVDSSIISAKGQDDTASLFGIENVLSVRVYYQSCSANRNGGGVVAIDVVDDGSMLRTQLHSVLRSKGMSSIPAYTVVPVIGMHFSTGTPSDEQIGSPFLGMQVTLVDSIRMETEMWVRFGPREYNAA